LRVSLDDALRANVHPNGTRNYREVDGCFIDNLTVKGEQQSRLVERFMDRSTAHAAKT